MQMKTNRPRCSLLSGSAHVARAASCNVHTLYIHVDTYNTQHKENRKHLYINDNVIKYIDYKTRITIGI